jgi:hypothetical protein
MSMRGVYLHGVAWFACLPDDKLSSKPELLETPRQCGMAMYHEHVEKKSLKVYLVRMILLASHTVIARKILVAEFLDDTFSSEPELTSHHEEWV